MNKLASPRLRDHTVTMKRCASVCRNLFGVGPMDNISNLRDMRVIRACLDERNVKRWNFDFRLGRPLNADGPSSSYEWTQVDNVESNRTPVKQMLQANPQSFRTPIKQVDNVITPKKPVLNTPRTSHTVKPAPLTVETFAPAINFNFKLGSNALTPSQRRHTIAVVSPPFCYSTPEKSKQLFGVFTPKTDRKMLHIQECSRIYGLLAASPKGRAGKAEPKRRLSMENKRKRNTSNYFPRKKRCSQRLMKSSMGALQRMC